MTLIPFLLRLIGLICCVVMSWWFHALVPWSRCNAPLLAYDDWWLISIAKLILAATPTLTVIKEFSAQEMMIHKQPKDWFDTENKFLFQSFQSKDQILLLNLYLPQQADRSQYREKLVKMSSEKFYNQHCMDSVSGGAVVLCFKINVYWCDAKESQSSW